MLNQTLIVSNFLSLIALATAIKRNINAREDRKLRGFFGGWPIKQVDLEYLDKEFHFNKLGARLNTEIRFLPSHKVEGGIHDLETWILCNLAKHARNIFEFGTCTGKTTYLLAANSPNEARIKTLTLSPEQICNYQMQRGDDPRAKNSALIESQFSNFVYSGTPEEKKIDQLFCDSKSFDERPYIETCDIVFVDGSHARSYVESDSRKALRMVKSGGIVLWHDYRGPRHTKGVFETLNDLSREIDLVHIKGTTLVAYKKATIRLTEDSL